MEAQSAAIPQNTPLDGEMTAQGVLDIVQQLALELHPHRRDTLVVTLDSTLDRELGFDSLGRVELLFRLERAFGVRLAEQVLATAEVPRDLVRAVQSVKRAGPPAAGPGVREVGLEAVAAVPRQAQTLGEVLDWHVQTHPERPHISLYVDDEQVEEITYGGLHADATAVATGLQAVGLQPGQTVALMLPTGRDFFAGFYGTLLAGGIPVPLYPPARPSQIEEHLRRQVRILANAEATVLITMAEAKPLARLLRAHVETLRQVVTVAEVSATHGRYVRPHIAPQDTAFLQYTSGSTGNPKGVILSHANLLANLRAMGQAVRISSADVFVSWLPLYHDMGLIGAWLGSLYYACRLVLMSPLAFLARPARWLWTIHRHGGTLSAGPNFAYELCLQKVADRDLEGLDLHTWRVAFNGAEPVSPATLERFSARFAPYGFRPEAMAPVYGLAEAALGVAFPPLGSAPQVDRIQRDPFGRAGRAAPAAADDPTALRFVGCGQPLPGYQIRVVDAAGYELGERQEGRLEFQGPSTTRGYFRHPDATRQLFHGEWLDSGDLGYTAAGTVYVSGRAKDLIIRAGRNLYPHELEEAIGHLTGIRQGCVAVFGSPDPVSGTERLVVLAETRETEPQTLAQLRQQVDALVVDVIGTPPDDVVLAPPGTVLKTSSGKIRRAASRERYEQGHLGRRQRAVWWQVLRLAVSGLWPWGRRLGRRVGDLLYAVYFWVLCGVLLPVTWSLVALLPRRPWRQAVVQTATRLLLRLAGTSIHVQGLEHLPQQGPYILVANHASYVDAPILTAVLPRHVNYVAKQELAEHVLTRVLLGRIGTEFVERFDYQQGAQDAGRLLQAVREGRSLVFFPEGTFGRIPGLQPFRMGAFMTAAQAGVPIIPLGMSGTRSMLRAGQWLPRRGQLRITIGKPLEPQGSDWSAAVALRDAARAQVARLCGEPDLAERYTE